MAIFQDIFILLQVEADNLCVMYSDHTQFKGKLKPTANPMFCPKNKCILRKKTFLSVKRPNWRDGGRFWKIFLSKDRSTRLLI